MILQKKDQIQRQIATTLQNELHGNSSYCYTMKIKFQKQFHYFKIPQSFYYSCNILGKKFFFYSKFITEKCFFYPTILLEYFPLIKKLYQIMIQKNILKSFYIAVSVCFIICLFCALFASARLFWFFLFHHTILTSLCVSHQHHPWYYLLIICLFCF